MDSVTEPKDNKFAEIRTYAPYRMDNNWCLGVALAIYFFVFAEEKKEEDVTKKVLTKSFIGL